MVRVLVIQHLYNLSDEAVEYQLLDRLSFQRFCLLRDTSNIPDRTTLWHFRQRIGTEGAQGIFDAVQQQLSAQGFMARGGQLIDASIVTAPIQHIKSEDKAIVKQTAMPIDWTANQDNTHNYADYLHMLETLSTNRKHLPQLIQEVEQVLSNIELEQLPSFQLGMDKGYDQGIEQNRLDTARHLLSLSLPLVQITQVTGLDEPQLQALLDEYESSSGGTL